ncbi:Gfo/Idh/MocA family protein [Micromonospora sp. CP22]|uniref:Gfo/Idh/MocA family protein n=1 Tax=Micromonospora sp. CP22 TaxID=2580517 RepID=UPI0012BC3ECB|nr:Gfo/Idh/MocA family oxidoreductase [Micromonospora sp. CP22]MTK01058.1 Gfo/Idh/MocA family oxidoreductase [Micromonospora sp. CP22]
MRFGLFGTGHWAAETHAAGLDAHPRADLVGVWGRDPDKAAALAARYGVPAFEDVDTLIEACDTVAVAVAPDIQVEIAVRAATAGRHLLLDKPLALNVADADRVVEAAVGSNVASVVFFTGRYQPEVAGFIAATAAAGGWHTAQVIRFASIFQPSSPYAQSPWRREHGALWDVGPHALAVLLPVLGRVARVSAADGPGGLVHLLLSHADGATSTVSLTLDAPPRSVAAEFVLYGESGIERLPASGASAATAFGVAIDQLLAEVDAGTRDHRCDVRFGREVVSVLAAAEAARAQGTVIDVPA